MIFLMKNKLRKKLNKDERLTDHPQAILYLLWEILLISKTNA